MVDDLDDFDQGDFNIKVSRPKIENEFNDMLKNNLDRLKQMEQQRKINNQIHYEKTMLN